MAECPASSRCTNRRQTSTSVFPAWQRVAVLLARSERSLFRPAALHRGRIPAAHTMDATDTVLLGLRFYGCFAPQVYSGTRMHSTLGYLSPIQFEQRWHPTTSNRKLRGPRSENRLWKSRKAE